MMSKDKQASKNNEADKEKSSRDDSGSSGSVKKHERKGHATATVRNKMEATKLRLGDKITTLQHIVSPFGKTDTASVLLETGTYIKFLQDQVRLLAGHPCTKANQHKDLRDYAWFRFQVRRGFIGMEEEYKRVQMGSVWMQ